MMEKVEPAGGNLLRTPGQRRFRVRVPRVSTAYGHRGAVIWGGKVWTRRMRRRATLAAAKRTTKAMMGKRRVMHMLWKELMRNFPAGTLG
jgi:hypothetical protein